MAKNVHKKRIAHNKTQFDNYEMDLDGNDILSNIMGAMDSNNTSVYSSKFETNFFEPSKSFSQNKVQFTDIPKIKQNVNVPKSKKYGLCRKFPLMEKTQRTLKQIQHNRKIPKPRAHLAGLSDSPLLGDNLLCVEKLKKNKLTAKEKNIAKTQNKKVIDETVQRKVTQSGTQKKKTVIEETKNEIVSKKNKPNVIKLRSAIEDTHSSKNDSNKKSEDDDSDGDFERFIRKEKKDLPKKPKCQKNPKSKTVKASSRKRVSKTISRTVESDSDSSSEAPESPKRYRKSNKRIKNHKVTSNRQSRISVEKNSESEMDIVNDQPCYDSFSENDEVGGMSFNNPCGSQFPDEIGNESNSIADFKLPSHQSSDISLMDSNQSTTLQKTQNVSLHNQPVMLKAPPTTTLEVNSHPSVQAPPTMLVGNTGPYVHVPSATLVANPQPNVPLSTSLVSNAHSNVDKVLHTTALVENTPVLNNSAIANSQRCDSFSVKNLPKKSSVIDLTESDNECEDAFMPKIISVSGPKENKFSSHSDESECEVVDVVIHDLPKVTEYPVKNNEPSSNDIKNIKTEKVNEIEHRCANPQSPINSNSTVEIEMDNTNNVNSQHDKKTVFKRNVKNWSNLNDEKPQSSVPINSESSVLNKKVKKEPCDDCVILDDIPSTRNLKKNTNIQNCNLNIKKEKVLQKSPSFVHNSAFIDKKKISKEEKLHEVACSNLINVSTIRNPELLGKERKTELCSGESLLETIKKEFSTYNDIVQMEHLVESTFKVLEQRQAEKLNLLRSQISEYLQNYSGSENCNAVQSVMNLLDTRLNSKSSKDSNKMLYDISSKSDISIQDLKTFSAMNIVPLSSISENDIKPNVLELHRTIKCEESTANETSSMSFGEKCVVCAKDASAACQQCAKVFFCSNECGVKYWESGHKNACVK